MNSAISYFTNQIQDGLCYPVWIEEERRAGPEIQSTKTERRSNGALRKMGRSEPIQAEMDNSLLNIRECGSFQKSTTNHSRSSHGGDPPSARNNRNVNRHCEHIDLTDVNREESRDTAPSRPDSANCNPLKASALVSALREAGSKDFDSEDLDEVISKMIRTRDDLIQQKMIADEEIKFLRAENANYRLENENLKNLVAIGKRLTAAQRDELNKYKVLCVEDEKRIKVLSQDLRNLQERFTDAKDALEGDVSFFEELHGLHGQLNGSLQNLNCTPGGSSAAVFESDTPQQKNQHQKRVDPEESRRANLSHRTSRSEPCDAGFFRWHLGD